MQKNTTTILAALENALGDQGFEVDREEIQKASDICEERVIVPNRCGIYLRLKAE